MKAAEVAQIPKGRDSVQVEPVALAFVVGLHLLAAVGAVLLFANFSWQTVVLAAVMYFACGFSITAGYHRLFSHRSYRASPLVRFLFLSFGAASFQRSALEWCAAHRIHHRYADEDDDPYSVQHGFWWAHVGWVVSRSQGHAFPRDLEADRLVAAQHRFWLPLAIAWGFGLPIAIASLWGDPWGGLFIAGGLRIVGTWHATWSVNSFAHRFGKRTYSATSSARDNFWVALMSLGEGYHNFHHRFQKDYRNGLRWYHYDPTKWLVSLLSRVGLAGGLVRMSPAVISTARRENGAA